MSLPPVKTLDSTNQIPPDEASAGTNRANSVNNASGDANGSSGAQPLGASTQKSNAGSANLNGLAAGAAGQQADDSYRMYSQQVPTLGQQPQQPQQQQQQQQQQQYPYYSIPPASYGQSQYQYPYYQGAPQTSTAASTTANQATQAAPSYADYNYSRMNYVQNYTPMYQTQAQGQMIGNNMTNAAAAPTAAAVGSQPGTQNITPDSVSGVGQVQPVGSRPRVTTTMWEDEKTLCYQVDANGVSVVRRADNNMINGTKLLNVAHMTRGRRDGILKSEKVRDVVKIGSMHLKGVWIPFERALAMAQREGIVDLLYPLFVRDIKQVIQQGSTTQPQANPSQQWGSYQTSSTLPAPAPIPMLGQQQQPSQHLQQPATQGPGSISQGQSAIKTSNSPYLTPTSLSNSSLTADPKNQPSQAPTSQPGALPQQTQQGYYAYPYGYPAAQYQYGYSSAPTTATGAATGASAVTTAGSTGGASTQAYQYPQYGYGYMPQYPSQAYDEQKDK